MSETKIVAAKNLQVGDIIAEQGSQWPVLALLDRDATTVTVKLRFPSGMEKPSDFDPDAQVTVLA